MAQPGITKPALSLVVPCYNEEECLAATARELLAAFAARGATVQLVLVDNGSHDRTSQAIDQLIAEGHPITKVSVQVNIGYGNGILQGFKHCTQPL
ncbi:MAG: glycosyltransferase, partial [Acidobacteria bacterium]|nr:glycosyltransferase [Acidobacteriota bacterium]